MHKILERSKITNFSEIQDVCGKYLSQNVPKVGQLKMRGELTVNQLTFCAVTLTGMVNLTLHLLQPVTCAYFSYWFDEIV